MSDQRPHKIELQRFPELDPATLRAWNGKTIEGERNRAPGEILRNGTTGDPHDEALFAGIKSFAAITAQPPHVIPWDIPGLLPSEDGPHLAFGAPGGTKSWTLKHAVDVMASGEDFLGRFPVRKRESSLYLNIDAGCKSFENRVHRISKNENAFALTLRGSQFNLAVLRKLLKRQERAFVVIDSLPAFFIPPTGTDPARAMRDFLEGIQSLYGEFGCGGMLADHPHRPKEPGGVGDYVSVRCRPSCGRAVGSTMIEQRCFSL
jgi:AAA domain